MFRLIFSVFLIKTLSAKYSLLKKNNLLHLQRLYNDKQLHILNQISRAAWVFVPDFSNFIRSVWFLCFCKYVDFRRCPLWSRTHICTYDSVIWFFLSQNIYSSRILNKRWKIWQNTIEARHTFDNLYGLTIQTHFVCRPKGIQMLSLNLDIIL